MRFSTFELLHDIDIQGRLFHKNNHIILNGKIFPFFFLQYLKIILSKQYIIREWINLDNEILKNDNENSLLSYNFNYYQENQTISEYNQKFAFIVDIKEKSELGIIKKIIDDDSLKNNYYIFFTYNFYESNLKTYSYYLVDDIICNENKIFFINFLKNNTSEKFFMSIDFLFKYFYKKIEKQLYLEFFFNFLRYIPNIKKNNMSEFIDNYIEDSVHLLLSGSIFDLSTCFFQKKIILFFEKWKSIQYDYSIEYWYYFWQDQLWFAQLALLNKENITSIIFYKKVNRWFLKTGINCYCLDDLLDASLYLYNLDYLHKKLQTNGQLDLNSFFYFWFKK